MEVKSTLLASLAHDLRTPLTAVSAAVTNLSISTLGTVERAKQTDVALAGLNRLTRLFDNILEMARIDSGGIAPSPVWTNPREVIETARRQVDLALRGHALHIIDHSDAQSVRIDPRLLAPALAHVLENAAQYSPRGSTITVTCKPTSDGLALIVEDEGAGIAARDMPHLFDRFYRGAESHRHVSGTGMGLAIVQGLLAAQGGHVQVSNRDTGGSRVAIYVPAETRSPAD